MTWAGLESKLRQLLKSGLPVWRTNAHDAELLLPKALSPESSLFTSEYLIKLI